MEDALRELILETVGDLVTKLLWEDRKDDEDLPRGVIQKAVAAQIVTADEIVQKFKESLDEKLTWT